MPQDKPLIPEEFFDLRQRLAEWRSNNRLSTYAHNVKIIVQDGKVTLKGPVRTGAEKQLVEQKAAAVAGATNVVNAMEVASGKN